MIKLINAEQAYKETKQIESMLYDKIIKNINNQIQIAISQGRYSINIYDQNFNDAIINKLREAGYKVETMFDQRDGDTITISWYEDD